MRSLAEWKDSLAQQSHHSGSWVQTLCLELALNHVSQSNPCAPLKNLDLYLLIPQIPFPLTDLWSFQLLFSICQKRQGIITACSKLAEKQL